MAENWIPKIIYGSGSTTITFDYPPDGMNVRGLETKGTGAVSHSADGSEQTSFNHLEEVSTVNFKMISTSLKDLMDTFMQAHALKGSSFDYYPHNGESTSYEYTLSSRSFNPTPMALESGSQFFYSFPLKMRREL